MTHETPEDPPRRLQTLSAEQEVVETLFKLGRQVTSVLSLDELLPRIPELIGRLIRFRAFAVYLLDQRCGDLRVAYSEGYPAEIARRHRLRVGEGLVGAAVAEERPLLVNDVSRDARYVEVAPGMGAELVVPLRHKGRILGALNLLSRERHQFTERDQAILRQFGAHVAVALENARLFERERRDARAFETLAAIGREVTSILNPDELLEHIALLTRRVIDYRTFGILLLNESRGELEMKFAVKYGEKVKVPPIKLGMGLVGHAALHKTPVLVADVSKDPRYIKLVDDVRSELVIPLLLKDRCIGVFDLESAQLGAFGKRDQEILTLLASQAAVAIENARLYAEIQTNEIRLENEIGFARKIQDALLPDRLPQPMPGLDVAARIAPARELGGDFYDLLAPDPTRLVVTIADVSGKGVPAALYSAFAGELVRSHSFRRRYEPERSSPAKVLAAVNAILHGRQLEHYFCALAYAIFDADRGTMVFSSAGLPYPLRCTREGCVPIELPGVPLGLFAGSEYDERSFTLNPGDVFVFGTDGVFEAMNASGGEFSEGRLRAVVERTRTRPAVEIVDAVFEEVRQFRGSTPPNDDMTAVVVKVAGV